jgi:hypothetical protein
LRAAATRLAVQLAAGLVMVAVALLARAGAGWVLGLLGLTAAGVAWALLAPVPPLTRATRLAPPLWACVVYLGLPWSVASWTGLLLALGACLRAPAELSPQPHPQDTEEGGGEWAAHADWPATTASIDRLKGTWTGNRRGMPYGRAYELSWPPDGRTQAEMLELGGVLETIEPGVQLGDIDVMPTKRPCTVGVLVKTTSLHEQELIWDTVPARSILEAKVGGRFSDGTPERTTFYTRENGGTHGLDAGAPGSGKSKRQLWKICTYGPAEDVRLWLADLKEGASFHRVAPLADWMVSTHEQAVCMLEEAVRVYRANILHMIEHDWDVWQPDAEHPVTWVITDEDAEFFDETTPVHLQNRARAALSQLGRKARAAGVMKDGATQLPDLTVTATPQYREQITRRRSYRMANPGRTDTVLPKALRGVDPAQIREDQPGVALIDDNPMQVRDVLVTREQERMIVSTYGHRDRPTPAWWHNGLSDIYHHRRPWAPGSAARPDGAAATGEQPETIPPIAEPAADPDPVGTRHDERPDLTEVPALDMEELMAEYTNRLSPEERAEEERIRARLLAPERPEGEAREILRALLARHQDPAGAGVTELQAATECGRGELWVHYELQGMCGSGEALPADAGRYRGRSTLTGAGARR